MGLGANASRDGHWKAQGSPAFCCNKTDTEGRFQNSRGCVRQDGSLLSVWSSVSFLWLPKQRPTNSHLKTREIDPRAVWRPEAANRGFSREESGWRAVLPLEALGADPSCHSPGFWGLPWLGALSSPTSASVTAWPSLPCVSVSSCKDMSHWVKGPP